MNKNSSLFSRVREFRLHCWNPDRQSAEYRANIVNWERIYVTRKLSAWITYALRNSPACPNHVTAAWVTLGVVGAFLLSFDVYWISILGVTLLYLSWLLDDVDGDLARHKQIFSIVGNFADMLGHQLIIPMVFCSLTLSMIRQGEPYWVICLGLLATVLTTPLVTMRDNALTLLAIQAMGERGRSPAETAGGEAQPVPPASPKPRRPKSIPAQLVGALYTHCAQLYLLLVAVPLGLQKWYLVGYGATIPVVFVPKFLVRARELAAISRDRKRLQDQFRPEWMDG